MAKGGELELAQDWSYLFGINILMKNAEGQAKNRVVPVYGCEAMIATFININDIIALIRHLTSSRFSNSQPRGHR